MKKKDDFFCRSFDDLLSNARKKSENDHIAKIEENRKKQDEQLQRFAKLLARELAKNLLK